MALHLSVNIGFQVLFHSPPGVLFTFPSLYCSTIGHLVVFRLGGWSLRLPARFLVSRGTLVVTGCPWISLTGLSPSMVGFPNTILLSLNNTLRDSATPDYRSNPVWPLPISLAATLEIDFSFSSCGYLDVSVPHVPFVNLWIQFTITEIFSAGFPHSEIHGSQDICSLPWLIAAYHVLLRLQMPRHSPYALFRLIIDAAHRSGVFFENSASSALYRFFKSDYSSFWVLF